MGLLKIENLTFYYPQNYEATLKNISLTIAQGEWITICGKSGCGKTTLLRHLKTALTPHGAKQGKIMFNGAVLDSVGYREQSEKIGFIMQSPESQVVTDKVWHELAFGLESLGRKTDEIRRQVAEMASFFGIQTWFHKPVCELSGGQKQLLNLASVMVMQPSVLILDEPSSQLDPIAASDFINVLVKINRELGTTIIMTEHRLDEVFPHSDRVVVMEKGRILLDGSPKEIGRSLSAVPEDFLPSLPGPMQIYSELGGGMDCPVTVREGKDWFDRFIANKMIPAIPPDKSESQDSVSAFQAKDVWFRYSKDSPDVVKDLNLKIPQQSIYGIVGGNGTGKTTTLSLLMNLQKPYRGKIIKDVDQTMGMLPQNPQTLFVKKTVRLDLLDVFLGGKMSSRDKNEKIDNVSCMCEIQQLMDRHPYDLSGGEQQRVALAKILLMEPDILLLDEPTKGIDNDFKQKLGAILKDLKSIGKTIVMVSHDVEFCAQYADHCAMFFDGSVVSEGRPRDFFARNRFYTTPVNRMVRHKIPDAVTVADVVCCCTRQPAPDHKPGEAIEPKTYAPSASVMGIVANPPLFYPSKEECLDDSRLLRSSALTKRTWAAAFLIFCIIPLTVYYGIVYLDDRKYLTISLLVMLESMLPFVMIFEGRKPQAKELVILAVLCSLAIAGRTAFFMIPQFKPVVAIVIISGVCFGGEAGFLVGAVTGFISNFYFGQGPWTPWQMFGFGIIGFLAGILFKKGWFKRNTLALCIFGGLATIFIYGGLMNPASVLMFYDNPNPELFMMAYFMGVPFDIMHAVATVFFLAVGAQPLLEKLDRIKEKYGLLDP